MGKAMPQIYLKDENPIDIINRNTEKLSALKLLLTEDNISVQLADIGSGLYFLFSDIEDQINYASQRIEERLIKSPL